MHEAKHIKKTKLGGLAFFVLECQATGKHVQLIGGFRRLNLQLRR
jgi:hypothetical protein